METVWKHNKFNLQKITKLLVYEVTCIYNSNLYIKILIKSWTRCTQVWAYLSNFFELFLLLHFIDILVDSTTHMVGSYGPKNEEQSYMTPIEEAPSGMLMRGAYKWVFSCLVCGTFMPGIYWSHSEESNFSGIKKTPYTYTIPIYLVMQVVF